MSVRHPIADMKADIAGGRLGHKAMFLVARSTLMELPAYVYGGLAISALRATAV
jgi:hypothetical protein